MTSGSLRLRLLAGGVGALMLALILAGFGLLYLFERQYLRSLSKTLTTELAQALAAIEVDSSGNLALSREPVDPRFDVPLSGLYWQITSDGGALLRSRSLWDASLALPQDDVQSGETHEHRIPGPKHSRLIALERAISVDRDGTPIRIRAAFAADLAEVEAARRAFLFDLVPALALLGGVLATAMWIQVSIGLSPLSKLQDAISRIKIGQARRIEGTPPKEVAPLVSEINGLLADQEAALDKARARAADLAHGLKTPLAALAADVRSLNEKGEAELAARIGQVAETMRRHIERELSRQRLRASPTSVVTSASDLKGLIQSLVALNRRTAHGRNIEFEIAIAPDHSATLDKTDLAEVLGNLIENATRHAVSRVRICSLEGGKLAIEDDGPGIPEAELARVIQRGLRLDEREGTTGLGLAIVDEVLATYGRSLTLERSELGGLRAVI